jgi:hypothetical protein
MISELTVHESPTICIYDDSVDAFTLSSRQARSLGVNAWILELDTFGKLSSFEAGLPFCIKWRGPFGSPHIAINMARVIKPIMEANLWAQLHGHPIVFLSDPKWRIPKNWIRNWLQLFSKTLGVEPIVLVDFAANCIPNAGAKNILKVSAPGHGAFEINGRIKNDYRGCLYTAYYKNPLCERQIIPLVPPPPLLPKSPETVESSPPMLNHTPGEYKKLIGQTAAVSRLLAPIDPFIALRLITSWQGHQSASCMNAIPLVKRKLNRKTSRMAHRYGHTQWVTHRDPANRDLFAVAIHGYHLDLLFQILDSDYAKKLRPKATLFISLQHGTSDLVKQYLLQNRWSFELIELPNRGRDVLPFIRYQLPRLRELGFPLFAKIHTKKSVHLRTGGDWGRWLGREILEFIASGNAEQVLANNPSVGLLGPQGAVAPMTLQLEKNVSWLETLLYETGLKANDFLGGQFVAGTMMLGRVNALDSLLEIGLTDQDFEKESGQLDGTLAHALERMIGASCIQTGYTVEEFTPKVPFETGLGYKSSVKK